MSKKEELQSTTFLCPRDLRRRVKEIGEENQRTLSGEIIVLLREGLSGRVVAAKQGSRNHGRSRQVDQGAD